MRVITPKGTGDEQPNAELLQATPTVGKALMLSGFALIVGLALLGLLASRLLSGQSFGINEGVFSLLMLILLAGAYLLGRQIPRAIRLEQTGRRVEGRIEGAWQEVDDDNERYFLVFSAGSQRFRQRVSKTRFLAYEAGDPVDIIQCADNPTMARLDI